MMSSVGRDYVVGAASEGRPRTNLAARVARLRERARDDFEQRGWPSANDPLWKGFSLDDVSSFPFARPKVTPFASVTIPGWIRGLGGRLVVLVDGRYPRENEHGARATEASCASLASELGRSANPALEAFGDMSSTSSSVMTSLNMARWEDGVWIEIPQQPTAPLIVIAHVATDQDAPGESHPRVLVTAAEGSRAVVVEVHVGPSSTATFVNAVSEIELGPRAELEHVRILAAGGGGWHIGSTHVRQHVSSRYASRLVSIGGHAVRDEVHVTSNGEGASTELDGLFLALGRRHLDQRTTLDHASPRGRSRQLYKGIADERGKGGFRGRVLVREGALGTDAGQVSRNLVLSRDALIDSAPELEIRADDVRCKHGSTTGAVDDDALFYLRCRGIGEREAMVLLTAGFAREVVDRIGPPALREAVAGLVDHDLRAVASQGGTSR